MPLGIAGRDPGGSLSQDRAPHLPEERAAPPPAPWKHRGLEEASAASTASYALALSSGASITLPPPRQPSRAAYLLLKPTGFPGASLEGRARPQAGSQQQQAECRRPHGGRGERQDASDQMTAVSGKAANWGGQEPSRKLLRGGGASGRQPQVGRGAFKTGKGGN